MPYSSHTLFETANRYVNRQLAPPGRIFCPGKQSGFGLTEESGEQGNQSDTDEGHTATGHQLLHTLRLCAGVIIAGLRSASVRAKRRSTGPAAPFQKVDRAPDTKTCTESYYQSLQNTDCAVEKCHKFFLLDLPAYVVGIMK